MKDTTKSDITRDTGNNRFIGTSGSAHRHNFPNGIQIADPALQPTAAPEGAVFVRTLTEHAANMMMFAQQEAIRNGETPIAPNLTILPSTSVAGRFDVYSTQGVAAASTSVQTGASR